MLINKFKVTFLLFLCITLFTNLTNAQSKPEFELHFFEVEQGYDPVILTYFEQENGNFFILKKEPIKGPGGWRYYIEIRDHEMTKMDVKEISSKLDADNYIIEDLILLDNSLMILSSKLDNKNDSEVFYSQKIDLTTLDLSDRNEIYKITYEKKRKRPSFGFDISQNKSYIMVTITPPYKRKEEEKITLHLMNSDLQTIWKREDFSLKLKDKDYSIQKIFVGDNGKVYMMGQEVNEMKDEIYELFVFTESDIISRKFDFEEEDIEKIGLGLNSKNQLILTSYFSNKETRGVKGIVYTLFDGDDLSLVKNIQADFDDDLILYGSKPKSIDKAKKKSEKKGYELGSYDLQIDHIILNDANEMTIIGQQFDIIITTYTDANGNTHTKTTYYYGSIYISKFSGDNTLIYNAKIPYVRTASRPITSYDWLIKDNKVSVIFLDNGKNLFENHMQMEGVKPISKYKNNVLAYVTVENDGTTKREVLYDYVKENEKDFTIYEFNNDIHSILMLIYKGKKVFNIGVVR